jgi:hypothetical protein
MKQLVVSLPTLGFLVATRAALGFGIGLLLADRLPAGRRRSIGLTLFGLGVATTVPALWAVSRHTAEPRAVAA